MSLTPAGLYAHQWSSFFREYGPNDEIHVGDIVDLFTASICVGDNRTACRLYGGEFIKTPYRCALPPTGLCPWRSYGTTRYSVAPGFSYSSNTTIPDNGVSYPNEPNTNRAVYQRRGAIVEQAYANYSPIYSDFGAANITSNTQYGPSSVKTGNGSGDMTGPQYIDPNYIGNGAQQINPALFDIIYLNARRGALSCQIIFTLPANNTGQSSYVDAFYNGNVLIRSYNGLIPFDSEALSNGEYCLYIFEGSGVSDSNLALYEFTGAYIDGDFFQLKGTDLKNSSNINCGRLYAGRIPSIPSDGSKYTRKRMRFQCAEVPPGAIQWNTSATITCKNCTVVAWISGKSKDWLGNEIP